MKMNFGLLAGGLMMLMTAPALQARENCHHDPVCQAKRDGVSVGAARDRDFELAHTSSAGRHIRNDSPEAQACMRANGFTLEMWLAHRAGSQAQVAGYLACKNRLAAHR